MIKTYYVYLVKSDDGQYFKIGYTSNINSRMAYMKESTPFDLTLVRKEFQPNKKVAIEVEDMLKHALRNEQAFPLVGDGSNAFDGMTEWFDCTNENLTLVDKMLNDTAYKASAVSTIHNHCVEDDGEDVIDLKIDYNSFKMPF